ncbi:hypothetical protein ACHAXN_008003, partial [Cyclotella atomus]
MKRPHASRTVLLLSAVMLSPSASFTPASLLNRGQPLVSKQQRHLQATTSTSSESSVANSLYTTLNNLYDKAQLQIKCPFLRRRIADCLDGTATLLQFLLIRHKSLGLSDPAILSTIESTFKVPGCIPTGRHIKTAVKNRHLSIEELTCRVQNDWTSNTNNGNSSNNSNKGYYITGRLDTTIYRDDCLFTGPDPDMPVRGLRKYLSAAAQLFDSKVSFASLDSISFDNKGGERHCGAITVQWTLGGVINLPWHPNVEPWTGWTRYHVDEEGLIYWHEEGWDVEVWRIFLGVVFPVV